MTSDTKICDLVAHFERKTVRPSCSVMVRVRACITTPVSLTSPHLKMH